MTIRPTKTQGDEEVWVADGLEDALMGYGEQAGQTVAVYDYAKCLDIFIERDGMDREEAAEHMSYNVSGTHLPGKTPVFLERVDEESTPTKFATQQHSKRPAGWA
jgi:hypothetical protein